MDTPTPSTRRPNPNTSRAGRKRHGWMAALASLVGIGRNDPSTPGLLDAIRTARSQGRYRPERSGKRARGKGIGSSVGRRGSWRPGRVLLSFRPVGTPYGFRFGQMVTHRDHSGYFAALPPARREKEMRAAGASE